MPLWRRCIAITVQWWDINSHWGPCWTGISWEWRLWGDRHHDTAMMVRLSRLPGWWQLNFLSECEGMCGV
jgi:hypothetical protein